MALPRKPLDQMRILLAAVEFIDANGLGKLTMRRLGAQLGVEAMALYRYVPGREQLLDGVVEVVMDELYETTAIGGRSTSWQEYLQMHAHAVRTLALEHPKIFPLVATRPPAAPWLRPPLRSLRWVEDFLEGLREYGFSSRASVSVYRSFATFLLGALLLEASTVEDLTTDEKINLAFIESTDLTSYPIISEMAEELKEGGFATEFEDALEDLIERCAQLRDH
ncbi:MAG TPA: TetR/AcrR family transcriptional regulator C-terminal domain-containing protein [Microlunatus sp.]|nr:TetR/AcrR family transcriptional regulator C-terminal domain-containing protein [Microlunatus sp.]